MRYGAGEAITDFPKILRIDSEPQAQQGWTWNCKLVAMHDNSSYSDLPDELVSQLSRNPDYLLKKAKRGFWNHYGFWSIVAAFAALALLSRKSS